MGFPRDSVQAFRECLVLVRDGLESRVSIKIERGNWLQYCHEAWSVCDAFQFLKEKTTKLDDFLEHRDWKAALAEADDDRFFAGIHFLSTLGDKELEGWSVWCREHGFPNPVAGDAALVKKSLLNLRRIAGDTANSLKEELRDRRQGAFFDYQTARAVAWTPNGSSDEPADGPGEAAFGRLREAISHSVRLYLLDPDAHGTDPETKNLFTHLTVTLPEITTYRFLDLFYVHGKERASDWLGREEEAGGTLNPDLLTEDVRRDYWKRQCNRARNRAEAFSHAATNHEDKASSSEEAFHVIASALANEEATCIQLERQLREANKVKELPEDYKEAFTVPRADLRLLREDLTVTWEQIRSAAEFTLLYADLKKQDDKILNGRGGDALGLEELGRVTKGIDTTASRALALWEKAPKEYAITIDGKETLLTKGHRDTVEQIRNRFLECLAGEKKKANQAKTQEERQIKGTARREQSIRVIQLPFHVLAQLGRFLFGERGLVRRTALPLLIMALIGLIGAGIYGVLQGKAYQSELQILMAQEEAVALESCLAENLNPRAVFRMLPWRPWRSSELLAENWIQEQRSLEGQLVKDLDLLESSRSDSFTLLSPVDFEKTLNRSVSAHGSLAADLSKPLDSRVYGLDEAWKSHLVEEQARLEADTLNLVEISKQKMSELAAARQKNTLAGLLTSFDSLAEPVTKRMEEIDKGVSALSPAPSTRDQLDQVAGMLSTLVQEIGEMEKRFGELEDAQDLSRHLEILSLLSDARQPIWGFLPPGAASSRKDLVEHPQLSKSFDSFLLGIPLAVDGVRSFNRALWRAPHPAETLSEELEILLALRDSWELSEIWTYQKSPSNPNVAVYTRGEINIRRETGSDGSAMTYGTVASAYDSSLNPNDAKFDSANFASRRMQFGSSGFVPSNGSLAAECRFFNRLSLVEKYLVSNSQPQWSRSLLEAVDQMLVETKINVLFKAYLHLRIGTVLRIRPDSWDLAKTDFLDDYDELKSIRDDQGFLDLDHLSWMVPAENSRWGSRLQAYYQSKQEKSYIGQLQHIASTISTLNANLFDYIGHVDGDGNLKLNPAKPSHGEVWGVGTEFGRLKGVPGNVSNYSFVPFSPVFGAEPSFREFKLRVENDPLLKKVFGPRVD